MVERADRERAGTAGRRTGRWRIRTGRTGAPGGMAHGGRVPPRSDRDRRRGRRRVPGLPRGRGDSAAAPLGNLVPDRGRSCRSEDGRPLGGRIARVRPTRRTWRHAASRASCLRRTNRRGAWRPVRPGLEPGTRRLVPRPGRPTARVHERAGGVRTTRGVERGDQSAQRHRGRPSGRHLPYRVVAGRVRPPRSSRVRGQGSALSAGPRDRSS